MVVHNTYTVKSSHLDFGQSVSHPLFFSPGIQEKLGLLNNGIVYTLYDYESQNFDELSFKNGTCIQVLRKGDDQEKEWWWSKIDDKEGYIPRNLIGVSYCFSTPFFTSNNINY